MDGELDRPVSLELDLPQGWKVSNGAIPMEGGPPTRFDFESYHELIDTPMLIGQHQEYTYEVGGIPHVAGFDTETVRKLCEKVAGGSFEEIFAGYRLVPDIEKMKKEQKGSYLGATGSAMTMRSSPSVGSVFTRSPIWTSSSRTKNRTRS